MPYYAMSGGAMSTEDRAQLRASKPRRILVDPTTGERWMITERPLQSGAAFRKVKKAEFEKVAAAVSAVEPEIAPPGPRVIQRGLAAIGWETESSSTREVELVSAPIGRGRVGLRVHFGAGRGRSMLIRRSLSVPSAATALVAGLVAEIEEDRVALAAILTSRSERPWLELPAIELPPKEWTEVRFDLSELPEARLTRVDRILLRIETDADEGSLLIGRLELCG